MQAETTQAPRARAPMNGVDVPTLFATINAVKGAPELARFQFRARTQWVNGTHSRTVIDSFSGAGAEQTHKQAFSYDSDHPEVLTGRDQGPAPIEFLLHALGACLTAGIGNIASARGVRLSQVESTIEGDINLLGILGLSDEVRNGYERLRVNFRIAGDAPAGKLREIVAQSQARSAVYDVLTRGVPVEITVDAE